MALIACMRFADGYPTSMHARENSYPRPKKNQNRDRPIARRSISGNLDTSYV